MIYLLIVSLIWAFSFGIIGNTLSGVNLFFIASLRLMVAFVIFSPFINIKNLLFRDCLYLFLLGFIQFGLMYSFYMKSYDFIDSHLVSLFSILTPAYVILINNIKNKKFSIRFFLAALLSILGAAIIKGGIDSLNGVWFGFLLMQCSGICFAIGQILYREWKIKNPNIGDISVFPLMIFGGVIASVISVFLFHGLTSFDSLLITAKSVSKSQWMAILYLGIVASGIGFYLWNKGAALSNPGVLAVFNNAVVPLAIFISLFVFGELRNLGNSDSEFIINYICRLIGGSLLIYLGLILATGSLTKQIKCILGYKLN